MANLRWASRWPPHPTSAWPSGAISRPPQRVADEAEPVSEGNDYDGPRLRRMTDRSHQRVVVIDDGYSAVLRLNYEIEAVLRFK